MNGITMNNFNIKNTLKLDINEGSIMKTKYFSIFINYLEKIIHKKSKITSTIKFNKTDKFKHSNKWSAIYRSSLVLKKETTNIPYIIHRYIMKKAKGRFDFLLKESIKLNKNFTDLTNLYMVELKLIDRKFNYTRKKGFNLFNNLLNKRLKAISNIKNIQFLKLLNIPLKINTLNQKPIVEILSAKTQQKKIKEKIEELKNKSKVPKKSYFTEIDNIINYTNEEKVFFNKMKNKFNKKNNFKFYCKIATNNQKQQPVKQISQLEKSSNVKHVRGISHDTQKINKTTIKPDNSFILRDYSIYKEPILKINDLKSLHIRNLSIKSKVRPLSNISITTESINNTIIYNNKYLSILNTTNSNIDYNSKDNKAIDTDINLKLSTNNDHILTNNESKDFINNIESRYGLPVTIKQKNQLRMNIKILKNSSNNTNNNSFLKEDFYYK